MLWSLSIEEAFYLAFPLVCLSLGRTRLFVPALIALVLSLPFTRAALAAQHNEIWFEKAYLPGMSAIAMGVLAAWLARRIAAPGRMFCIVLSGTGIAGLCAVLFAGRTVWTLLHHGYGLLLRRLGGLHRARRALARSVGAEHAFARTRLAMRLRPPELRNLSVPHVLRFRRAGRGEYKHRCARLRFRLVRAGDLFQLAARACDRARIFRAGRALVAPIFPRQTCARGRRERRSLMMRIQADQSAPAAVGAPFAR